MKYKKPKNFKGEITSVIIAHRLSTIIEADQIYVINKGYAIEEGLTKNYKI